MSLSNVTEARPTVAELIMGDEGEPLTLDLGDVLVQVEETEGTEETWRHAFKAADEARIIPGQATRLTGQLWTVCVGSRLYLVKTL